MEVGHADVKSGEIASDVIIVCSGFQKLGSGNRAQEAIKDFFNLKGSEMTANSKLIMRSPWRHKIHVKV